MRHVYEESHFLGRDVVIETADVRNLQPKRKDHGEVRFSVTAWRMAALHHRYSSMHNKQVLGSGIPVRN